MKYQIIDPVFEELQLVKPILLALVFAISCLFIADKYTSSKCGCGGQCECECETECSSFCECGLVECKGGGGYEYVPESLKE